jgi:hypothetical protein
MIYLIDLQGEVGDPTTAMHRIAPTARSGSVREVVVEPNFGQGMWVTAFQPILLKECIPASAPCRRASGPRARRRSGSSTRSSPS